MDNIAVWFLGTISSDENDRNEQFALHFSIIY